jgi:hypothetical protein
MADAERIWREKSDEDLLEAAAELDEFTAEGQQIIQAELKRRGLEDPLEQAGAEPGDDEQEALECLRCHTPLRYLDPRSEPTPEWRWAGRRVPVFDPSGVLHVYACPTCGHVELFMDVLPEDEPGN